MVQGGCLLLGGVSAPRGFLLWGVATPGGCLLWGGLGLSAPMGGVCSGGWGVVPGSEVSALGDGIPACTEVDPPMNRMTNRCKNITLATTSLWPVKTADILANGRIVWCSCRVYIQVGNG